MVIRATKSLDDVESREVLDLIFRQRDRHFPSYFQVKEAFKPIYMSEGGQLAIFVFGGITLVVGGMYIVFRVVISF